MIRIQQLTKRVDWETSPLIRRWGVKGARRFYILWGAFMYSLLLGISVRGLGALFQLSEEMGSPMLVWLALALIITAASLLTRMLLRIFAEFRNLKQNSTREPNQTVEEIDEQASPFRSP